MVDTEKKLTVTFGNFSCTLSGFDDPFPVMRTVVDYFHELSKRDPSFGSKSEHVDTEMLRALAEQSGSASVEAQFDGSEIDLSVQEQEQTAKDLTDLLTGSISEAPIFDVDDTFVDIAAEDIDFAVGARSKKTPDLTENSDQETASAETNASDLTVEDESSIAATIETSFSDLDEHKAESAAASTDELPRWATELVSDEPLENRDFPEISKNEQEQHTAFEDVETAKLVSEENIEIVENADSEPPEIDPENPLSELRDDFLSAQDVVASEDTPLKVTEQELHDATPHFEEESLNRQSAPLRLGFGDTASFDATKDVESATLDVRATPDASKVLEQIGLYSGDAENENFDWEDIREAVPSAFEPKEAAPAETPETHETRSTPAKPQFQNRIMGENVETFSGSTVELNIPDPRKDLRSFAQSTGAESLPELVEASAAFITLVNGRPSFSRGEILGLVDQFGEDESFTQKARIKSFGKLVRSGRITRTENGDYTIAGSARSEYESRIAI